MERFWSRLSEQERTELWHAGGIRVFSEAEVLFRGTEPASNLAVLLTGTVRVISYTASGRAVVLAHRYCGDIVGELAAFSGHARAATVEALEPVRALYLSYDRLNAVAARHPHILHEIIAATSSRLREADRRRVEMATTDLIARVATLLLEKSEQYGRHTAEGVVVRIASQGDLAGMMGMSRESVTRSLARLREMTAIKTERGSIVILDTLLLTRIAEGNAAA